MNCCSGDDEMYKIVDFYADWCGPCKMMKPVFEELSKEMTQHKFEKINVEENQELATKNQVQGIPCIIVYKDDKEVDRIVGFRSKEDLKKEIEKLTQ